MTESEKRRAGIDTLPGIRSTRRSSWPRRASWSARRSGSTSSTKFIENKKIEWDQYRIQVTGYEIESYLPIL